MKLTKEECEELLAKIDNEGFDYYFTDYGADEKLEELVGKEIKAYKNAKVKLENALAKIGVDIESY